jgi:hypothetical protein
MPSALPSLRRTRVGRNWSNANLTFCNVGREKQRQEASAKAYLRNLKYRDAKQARLTHIAATFKNAEKRHPDRGEKSAVEPAVSYGDVSEPPCRVRCAWHERRRDGRMPPPPRGKCKLHAMMETQETKMAAMSASPRLIGGI